MARTVGILLALAIVLALGTSTGCGDSDVTATTISGHEGNSLPQPSTTAAAASHAASTVGTTVGETEAGTSSVADRVATSNGLCSTLKAAGPEIIDLLKTRLGLSALNPGFVNLQPFDGNTQVVNRVNEAFCRGDFSYPAPDVTTPVPTNGCAIYGLVQLAEYDLSLPGYASGSDLAVGASQAYMNHGTAIGYRASDQVVLWLTLGAPVSNGDCSRESTLAPDVMKILLKHYNVVPIQDAAKRGADGGQAPPPVSNPQQALEALITCVRGKGLTAVEGDRKAGLQNFPTAVAAIVYKSKAQPVLVFEFENHSDAERHAGFSKRVYPFAEVVGSGDVLAPIANPPVAASVVSCM